MVKRYIFKPAILLAALLVTLLSVGSVLAAPVAQEGKKGLFGTVTVVEEGSITVQKDEETVVLKVDANVKVFIPGVEAPKISDISVGSRVAVVTEQRPDGTYATLISVIASQPKQQHITITVVEVSGRTVIGETADGEQVVVELDFDPPPDLKGQIATFLGEQPESNRFKARALQKLQDVVDRLVKEIAAKKLDVQAEREQSAKDRKQNELDDLKGRLETNLRDHLDRLGEVVSKAPPQSKEALEQALEKIKQGYKKAAAALEKAPQDVENLVEHRTIVGQVESLDTAAGMIGVRTRGDALVNIEATADTQVRIDEIDAEPGTLSDVHVGDPVQVLYDPKTGVAFTIRLLVIAKVEGLVRAVVPAIATSAPVLAIELAGGAILSLTVLSSAEIGINHRPATIDGLTQGMQVAARYNSRTLQLINLDAELEAEFKLTIEQVDLSGKTITGRTADGKSVTVKVTDKTRVEAKGNLSSIVGLQPGTTITVRVNPVTNEALRIVVEEPKEGKKPSIERARGTVKFFNESKTLTLVLPNKSELTLTLGPFTKISADGDDATPADIQTGLPVTVAYNADTRVIGVIELHKPQVKKPEQQPERPKFQNVKVEGVITALDPAQGTLTIFTRRGEKLVVRVFPETNIVLNDKRLKALSELPVAAAVTVEYSTNGNVAFAIVAEKKEVSERTLVVPHVLEANGTIIDVALAKGVVVIKTEKGETLTLTVNADTQIAVNEEGVQRRVASLANLTAGATVEVEYTSEGVARIINVIKEVKVSYPG